jgi:hypothetical protein
MPFKYSCFISYRNHEQSELAKNFITELHDALRNELTVRIDKEIFVDSKGIGGGNFVHPTLSRALCTSVCMVPVYTPTYFNRRKPYCAREYHAMETLETRRLARLPQPFSQECGLIFPVILRGEDGLPAQIKDKRFCYNFERFDLGLEPISKNPNFKGDIRAMAKAIHARAEMLEATGEDMTCDCDGFNFPSEEEVLPWLDSIVPLPQPFPLRKKSP